MTQSLAIAVGGALGALLRYWVSVAAHAAWGAGFPYGTLVANALGSLVMGALSVLLLDRIPAGPELRAGLLVGVLGAFTTFSTFSLETLHLLESGARLRAFGNIALNLGLCLLAVWLGVAMGRRL